MVHLLLEKELQVTWGKTKNAYSAQVVGSMELSKKPHAATRIKKPSQPLEARNHLQPPEARNHSQSPEPKIHLQKEARTHPQTQQEKSFRQPTRDTKPH